PLSKRAIATDFRGEFHTEYDSLNSLKSKLHALDKTPPAWWTPRDEELFKAVHYPATTAATEWASEILTLDQLLVEGFKVRVLRDLARHVGRLVDPKWASLKLVEECLIGAGVDQEDARGILDPLRSLHDLRSVLKGHA